MLGTDSEDLTEDNNKVELVKAREREFHFKDNSIEKWGLRADMESWEILKVSSGKKGDLLGIRPGWKLLKVNNLTCNEENKEDIKPILSQGEECTLLFQMPPEGEYYTDEDDDLNDDPDFGMQGKYSHKNNKTSWIWYVIRFLSICLNIAFIIYFYRLFSQTCPAQLDYEEPPVVDVSATSAASTARIIKSNPSIPTTTTRAAVSASEPNPNDPNDQDYKRIGPDCGLANTIWSNPPVITSEPGKCIEYVRSNAACHQGFFAHGTQGDARCGCFVTTFTVAQCDFAYRQWGVNTYEILKETR